MLFWRNSVSKVGADEPAEEDIGPEEEEGLAGSSQVGLGVVGNSLCIEVWGMLLEGC